MYQTPFLLTFWERLNPSDKFSPPTLGGMRTLLPTGTRVDVVQHGNPPDRVLVRTLNGHWYAWLDMVWLQPYAQEDTP